LLWGWQASGAIVALPLASSGALLLALWLLRGPWRAPADTLEKRTISWNYSLVTLLGLLIFALIVNMDALVVKRVFSPEVAGNYGPVVTLGKMNLFIPLAMGLVLFPKVTQRQATGRDPRPILLLALAAALLPGLALTAAYALAPGLLVQTIFGDVYAAPGVVLPLVGLATTLYAGLNIWLNYALSAGRYAFVYTLAATLLIQATTMALFHRELLQIALAMVGAGVVGNIAGITTTVARRRPVGYT
jgi:O-antigen/teichoic acid export membrane protein